MVKLAISMILWFIGAVAIIYVLSVMGLSERVIGFAVTGALFGLIAHIRTTENWKALKKKNLLSASTWNDEMAVVRNTIRPKFSTSSERGGFVLLIVSLGVALVAYVTFGLGHSYYNLLDAIVRGSRSASPYDTFFYLGCSGVIVGTLLSYFRQSIVTAYDATLGRLVKWVRSGE